MKIRHEIGIDNITWECDYPHSDSIWPNSRRCAEEFLAEVPDDEADKIVDSTPGRCSTSRASRPRHCTGRLNHGTRKRHRCSRLDRIRTS